MPETMRIHIKNLRAETIIGVTAEEQLKKREVIINLWLGVTVTEAVTTDALEDTLDYKSVSDRVVTAVERSHFKLVESLAHHIVSELTPHPKLISIIVEVIKPGALKRAESVSVTIAWERAHG